MRRLGMCCVALPLFLASCITVPIQTAPGKQADNIIQSAPETRPIPNTPPVVLEPGVSKGELAGQLESVVKKISQENQSSNNANQNTITGLGANINKLAEKVQGFGGDLAHVEANISTKVDTKFDALAKITVDMKNELKAEVNSVIDTKLDLKFQANATASATANTQLKADLEHAIEAKVQAGIGNKMESLAQEVKAGRDSYVDNTKVANQWVWIVLVLCLVIVAIVALFAYLIIRLQVKRADQAERHAEKAMDIHADVVTRALLGGRH